jgi:hypothetical protein
VLGARCRERVGVVCQLCECTIVSLLRSFDSRKPQELRAFARCQRDLGICRDDTSADLVLLLAHFDVLKNDNT